MMEGIPDPALVVLVGASGSGKSTWAAKHFRSAEVVSSDQLRAVVGTGEHDLDASPVAFSILDQIVEARMQRRLLTVVDTLGLDDERRARHISLANELGLPAILVLFDVPEHVARHRNRLRERPVPASVLTSQLKRLRRIAPRLESEGWHVISPADDIAIASSYGPLTSQQPASPIAPGSVRFYLQISRFKGEGPLGSNLAATAKAAEQAGFTGVALMDHLVQIPQVGREWEALPEPYISLAYLAGMTARLELGVLVSGVTIRNPALLAKMVATLDVLSDGRAFCGLGLGWFKDELVAYGFDMPSLSRRRDILLDTLNILPLMWGPGRATYQGKVHSVFNASCYPRPLHRIPIIVGGRGKQTLELAARFADGANLAGSKDLGEQLEVINSALRRLGRDAAEFEISVLDLPLIGEDRNQVAALIERWRGRQAAATFAARHKAGTPDVHVERFKQMAGLGVRAVYVAPVGLNDPDDVGIWRKVIDEFA